ncbi:hypothetical protein [Bradyrhizobium zhanjiangense]|uniref:hypothetical protein n=1 Tax=Bradyrhizobium zhanjiangense TaxID=1325107 RepID=UPI001008DF9E|nr:hypothetical protein [Bradyrhizobium zhanjiangense]
MRKLLCAIDASEDVGMAASQQRTTEAAAKYQGRPENQRCRTLLASDDRFIVLREAARKARKIGLNECFAGMHTPRFLAAGHASDRMH